jgi:glycosyltransferase involved in cell wall biosynthesis
MKFDLADNFSVNSSKLKLIPNLLDKDKIDISLQEEWSKFSDKFILFVGTINQNKRLDKVIKFHQRILTHLYDFDLVIVGDGPQVDQLLLHIRSSEYSNRIHFMGSTLNPYSIMRKASFLIITSDYEGFPNVGIEAQYCGCPVIVSHDTKGGAIELISDSFNGKVVNLNSDDCSFLNDVFDRKEISESIKLKHGFQNVVNRYQELF